MIKAIVSNVSNWNQGEILRYCQELVALSLQQEPDEVIEEMYNEIGGESIN